MRLKDYGRIHQKRKLFVNHYGLLFVVLAIVSNAIMQVWPGFAKNTTRAHGPTQKSSP